MTRSSILGLCIICGFLSEAASDELTSVPTNPAAIFDLSRRPLNFPSPFEVQYKRVRTAEKLKITYNIPFFTALKQGHAIIGEIPEYNGDESIVTLDFKLNNTTRSTKYASSLTFKVLASRIVDDDLPIIYSGVSRFVVGENIGWGTLSQLTASYAIVSLDECSSEKLKAPVLLKKTVPNYYLNQHEETFQWPISPADIPGPLLAQARNQPYVCVIGTLDYNSGGQSRRKLFATNYLLDGGVAASLEPSATYNLFLEAGHQGYSLNVPISNFLRPNEPDRFLVKVSSNKSAFFDFEAAVDFTDATHINLGRVELDYFRPKGVWKAPGKEIPVHR
jgi:hypothetical protein